MEKEKRRLAFVEDNPMIYTMLKKFFEASSIFDVIIAANSAEEFMGTWKEQSFDILLCDIELPGKSGVDCTYYVKRRAPNVQVVMFTMFGDQKIIFKALCAGASGYLLKDMPLRKVEEHLLEVLEGGSVMSPKVTKELLSFFNQDLEKKQLSTIEQLSPREAEIVALLHLGIPYKEIASRLYITSDTVKYHIRNIFKKFEVHSRTELIAKF